MNRGLGAVQGVTVYKRDVVVRRRGGHCDCEPPARGLIKEFSYKSRQRLAFIAANTAIRFTTMITLTYPAAFPSDGLKVKRDLRAFLDFIRHDLNNPHYLWFLEFQHRGAPHIHLLIDFPFPRARIDARALRFRVSATWYRIVGSHDEKHLAAGTRTDVLVKPDGAARYAVKYAMKMRQKIVPAEYQNVGRFWGCSRDVIPRPVKIVSCTEDDIRGTIEGWTWAPKENQDLYAVLYGVAHLFEGEDTTFGG